MLMKLRASQTLAEAPLDAAAANAGPPSQNVDSSVAADTCEFPNELNSPTARTCGDRTRTTWLPYTGEKTGPIRTPPITPLRSYQGY
jgi:hypothetical protein